MGTRSTGHIVGVFCIGVRSNLPGPTGLMDSSFCHDRDSHRFFGHKSKHILRGVSILPAIVPVQLQKAGNW
jgi:hypothetical protein